MKNFTILGIFLFISTVSIAQKIDGQWRGSFNSAGDIVIASGENTEYVLELEINGTEVTGFSYSYFQDRKYFVICSLKGIYHKADKTMLVTEIERIKGLTPIGWADCLQTHYLKYQKIGTTEELVGNWKAISGDCGNGYTTLIRKHLIKTTTNPIILNKNAPILKPKAGIAKVENKTKVETIIKRTPVHLSDIISNQVIKNKMPADTILSVPMVIRKIATPIILSDISYEKRTNNLLKTIEIENDSFQIELYDSGEIDGDSISLFYNGKLLLAHQRLELKPITLTLNATTNNDINDLTMYAETLGTIPPNTGLMVVTDGKNRYEVYMTSDLKQSGTIRFIHKKNKNASF